MNRTALRSIVLSLALGLTTSAAAQTVTVHDLTVDDEVPPSQYRAMLDAAIGTAVIPIRACYLRELATHPGLAGDLRLRLWVSARQVIRVTPETTIGDPALETCAHDEVHRFTLPPQAPEGGARVRFVMRFTPGATPPPPPPTVRTAPVAPPTSIMTPIPPARVASPFSVRFDRLRGGLTTDQIAQALPSIGFASCGPPSITGSLPLTVSVTAAGVATARPARGTLRDTTVRACIVGVIQRATFPAVGRTTRFRATVSAP